MVRASPSAGKSPLFAQYIPSWKRQTLKFDISSGPTRTLILVLHRVNHVIDARRKFKHIKTRMIQIM